MPSRRDQTAIMARQLSEQYQKAIGGLFEVVRFGAMMIVLREKIGVTDTAGRQTKGDGLKPWLTEHCPGISHASAFRFMAIAEAVHDELHLGKRTNLAEMVSTPVDDLPQRLAKKRRELEAFLEGKSQRQLLLSFGNPDAGRRGGDRGNTHRDETPEQKEKRIMKKIREDHDKLQGNLMWYVREGGWLQLSHVDKQAFQGTLENALREVKKHNASLK